MQAEIASWLAQGYIITHIAGSTASAQFQIKVTRLMPNGGITMLTANAHTLADSVAMMSAKIRKVSDSA